MTLTIEEYQIIKEALRSSKSDWYKVRDVYNKIEDLQTEECERVEQKRKARANAFAIPPYDGE